jgi:hypothetical protein
VIGYVQYSETMVEMLEYYKNKTTKFMYESQKLIIMGCKSAQTIQFWKRRQKCSTTKCLWRDYKGNQLLQEIRKHDLMPTHLRLMKIQDANSFIPCLAHFKDKPEYSISTACNPKKEFILDKLQDLPHFLYFFHHFASLSSDKQITKYLNTSCIFPLETVQCDFDQFIFYSMDENS